MKIVALAGGVGGAKLVDGFNQVLSANQLTVIVNTGDDFEYLGMKVCPDLDTVCYTLAGISNPINGWGRASETWNAYHSLVALGGPGWFHLGDLDLGTHLERTRRLKAGQSLTQITKDFCQSWGIDSMILPMSNDSIPTIVLSDEGDLPFQEYFVKRKCEPKVKGFYFENVENSKPAPGVTAAIQEATLLVICPSNPLVSIDPILSVPGIVEAIQARKQTGMFIVAVSPIIGGEVVKGPLAKMYREMGISPSASCVAKHYAGLLDGYVFDVIDSDLDKEIKSNNVKTLITNTIMKSTNDRAQLAIEIIDGFQ